MKKTVWAVMLGMVVFTAPISKADQSPGGTGTTQVELPVRALLTPAFGFEEKNNVQVVLWGELPNQCYTVGTNDIQPEADGKTVLVRQYALHDTTGLCADENTMPADMKVAVPFTSVVSVGHFAAGEHEFAYDSSNGQTMTRTMYVRKNVTSNIDTLPYAAVSAVTAPDIINGETPVKVHITGVLNSTCTTLNPNVQVMRENDVWVLLPTVLVKTGVECAQVMVPFDQEVNLGPSIPGVHLVHVRSMNGMSQNKVVVVSR